VRLHLYTGYDKQVLVERLIEQGHDVSAVVVPRAEKYRGHLDAFLTRVGDLGIPVFEVRRGDISETVTLDDPATVLVSVGFPLILRLEAFSRYQHAVNFHPTLLPRHRGKYLNYVLLEADTETGITAHLIDEGIDTGPILAQEVIEVSSFDTIRSIKRRTLDVEPNFVLAVLGDIDRLVDVAVPQDESLATLHLEPREPSDSELDASLPLHDLLPKIRASDPEFYPAYFWLDGHRVVVSLAREDRPQTEQDMI
jgi:methionyl-tRNA formyltransferase